MHPKLEPEGQRLIKSGQSFKNQEALPAASSPGPRHPAQSPGAGTGPPTPCRPAVWPPQLQDTEAKPRDSGFSGTGLCTDNDRPQPQVVNALHHHLRDGNSFQSCRTECEWWQESATEPENQSRWLCGPSTRHASLSLPSSRTSVGTSGNLSTGALS